MSPQNASAGSAIIVSAPLEMRARCAAVSGMTRSMKIAAGDQLVLVEGRGAVGALGEPRLRGLGHLRPHVAERDQAEEMQVVGRGGAGIVGVGHAVLHQPHGRRLQIVEALLQRLGERRHLLVGAVLLAELVDLLEEGLHGAAAIAAELAADQVERLDAVGALVDHGDAGIAHELAHAVLFDVAVAAEDLLAITAWSKPLSVSTPLMTGVIRPSSRRPPAAPSRRRSGARRRT